MSKSITQDMAYRQSLMRYTDKYSVSRASWKYKKSRSYIYFWKARWDGTVQSLACQSRRPHTSRFKHYLFPIMIGFCFIILHTNNIRETISYIFKFCSFILPKNHHETNTITLCMCQNSLTPPN